MAIYLLARQVLDVNASCTKCNSSPSPQPCLPHEEKWRRLPGSTTVTMTPDITRTGGKPERPTGVETSPCSPSGFGEPGLLFQRVAGFSFVPIPAVSSSSTVRQANSNSCCVCARLKIAPVDLKWADSFGRMTGHVGLMIRAP